MRFKISLQILGGIGKIFISGIEFYNTLGSKTVRIFFKCRISDTYCSRQVSHKALYKFCSPVSYRNIIMAESEIFGSKQGINAHS
ncbi:hypothetical protein IMSAG025_02015 [Muribaculaceae bacterium]|nr:hypothetical protein IMSAG025_02015 [Muribaculaceae bacterium]